MKKKKTKKTKDGDDSDSDDDESSDDSDDEMNLERRIPKSHEVQLNHGSKAISAMAIDPSGSRLVTGSIDYEVKFWDFAGMDASLRSFRLVANVAYVEKVQSDDGKLMIILPPFLGRFVHVSRT